jgi:hypothetical protein
MGPARVKTSWRKHGHVATSARCAVACGSQSEVLALAAETRGISARPSNRIHADTSSRHLPLSTARTGALTSSLVAIRSLAASLRERPIFMIESACGAASAPRNCGPLRNDHRADKQGLSTLGEHRPECGGKQLPQHGSAGTTAARSPRRNPPRPYERSIVIPALPDQPWG